jgi:NAD(P)-dependent dehydrogenase (short-subunit alcohol dehydrogenase family)
VTAQRIGFEERVAVVTGAGRGLGRSHALLLAERGARVVVNDLGTSPEGGGHDPALADHVVAEIRAAGGTAVASAVDVSTPAGGDAVAGAALDAFGRVDVVVANAGLFNYRRRPFVQSSLESMERQWRSHVGGTYNVVRAAWPHLLDQGYGRVVITCSSAGLYGMAGHPEYCSAKAALQGLTFSLALEGRDRGVLVNALAPVAFTRMNAHTFATQEAAAGPRRYFRPELVSPVVAWLASEACTSAGGLYQGWAGRVAKVAIGEPPGHHAVALTPESVAEHLGDAVRTDVLDFPADAESWGHVIMTRAAALHEPAADRTGRTG